MDIRNIRELKNIAARRLRDAQDEKKIALIYAGITVALSLLVEVVCYCLELQINQSGGLSNIGTRSFLSTLTTVLPIVQSLALMCLELGFTACMIRISRGLYTSPQTLRAGMSRFWAMVRSGLLMSAVYLVVAIASFYLATMIYAITPLSNAAMEILLPLFSNTTALDSAVVIDEATAWQLVDAMEPLFIVFLILYAVLVFPITYRYRMVNYVLMDKPQAGALMALRESKAMMRRNGFALFKIDLSFWWYYGLNILAALLCYAGVLLPLMGVTLPFSETVSYYGFYLLFLAAEFAIYYFFRNRVQLTYTLVYEALRPRENPSGGVVLGNIFQM